MNVTKRRMFLLLCVVCAVFLAAIMAWHYHAERSALDLYARAKQHDSLFVTKMLELDGSKLAILNSDYSYWDEMVTFVHERSPVWAEANLAECLETYAADSVAVYDTAGKAIYSKARDEFPDLESLGLNPSQIRHLFSSGSFQHLFIQTAYGLLEIRAATIVPSADSEHRTPAQGYWLVSRLWGDDHLKELGTLLNAKATIMQPGAGQQESPDEAALRTMVFRQPLHASDGSHIRTLRITRTYGEVTAQRASANAIMKVLVVFAGCMLLALLLCMSLWVTRPVALLAKSMKSESPSALGGLPRERTEFGQLASLVADFFAQKDLLEAEVRERVLAEAKLASERERLATTLRSIGDGVIAVDIDGNVSIMNPVAEQLTGWDTASAVGRPFGDVFDAVHQRTRERIACPVEMVLRTGRPVEVANHTVLISRDGTERCIADSCAPILDASGTMTGVVLVFRDETERQRARDALVTERDKAQRYLDVAGNLFVALDAAGKIVMVNRQTASVLGYEPAELVGGDWFDTVIAEEQRPAVKQVFCDLMSGRGEWVERYENDVVTRDGDLRTIAWHNVCLRDSSGNVTGTLSSGEDITLQMRAEHLIRLQSAAINAADDLIAILDLEGRIVFANDAFARQTGYELSELPGKSLSLLWPHYDRGAYDDDVWDAIAAARAWSGEMQGRSSDGVEYTADVSITPLIDPTGRSEHLIVIGRNITERKQYEGLLDYQAHHDALTGLPNRLLFVDELESAMQRHRKKRKRLAVLFIDLDKFKMVNDSMGHQAGDAILVESADRLASCLRKGDILARLGGDEFTALLQNLRSLDDAKAVANRMLLQFSTAFNIRSGGLVIGASIGVAIYPDNATDAKGLLASADVAMYRAKDLGRNNFQLFSDELGNANQARIEIECELRQAVERDELEVYYQPIVDLRTMQIAGAEALCRWNHPEKGMISPGVFVPIAEETGLILPVGRMVLETACQQCKEWHSMGHRELEVSLNVSPVQLRSKTLPSEVARILQSTGLDPGKLNLEITESVLAKNDHGEIEALKELRQLGIVACLDDFGIGYSSLSRLKDFPVIHMKVDGSFIREIQRSEHDKAMTELIVTMAHSLGIKVTAEWVESEEQLGIVRLLGCDYAQGYLISPALPASQFPEFMKTWSERMANDRAA